MTYNEWKRDTVKRYSHLNEYRPSNWTNEQWADAIHWAVDNTWFSDHEDESGNFNESTYDAEIESKVAEYVYESTL